MSTFFKKNIKYIIIAIVLLALFFFVENIDTIEKYQVNVEISQQNARFFINSEQIKQEVEQILKNNPKNQWEDKFEACERRLNKNPYIDLADIYLKASGEVGVKIKPHNAFYRVFNENGSYFIGDKKNKMPTMPGVAVELPLVYGILDEDNLDDLEDFFSFFQKDKFFKDEIEAIKTSKIKNKNASKNTYSIILKSSDIVFFLGEKIDLEKKTENLKIIYSYLQKNDKLNDYKFVNLEFVDYVICNKKTL